MELRSPLRAMKEVETRAWKLLSIRFSSFFIVFRGSSHVFGEEKRRQAGSYRFASRMGVAPLTMRSLPSS